MRERNRAAERDRERASGTERESERATERWRIRESVCLCVSEREKGFKNQLHSHFIQLIEY